MASLLTVISATPIIPPGQSPAVDRGNVILRRNRPCSTTPCANPEGRWVIYSNECVLNGCGLCDTRGFCLQGPSENDHYDPRKPGNPFGGAGSAASNGAGSRDSSNTCHGDDVQDDAQSCPTNGKKGATGGRAAAPNTRKPKASCAGSCSTSAYDGSCGSGCGCNFAGTGLFGGLDGSCVRLVSFGGL